MTMGGTGVGAISTCNGASVVYVSICCIGRKCSRSTSILVDLRYYLEPPAIAP